MATSTFTDREQKLLAAACQSFEGEPKLNFAKFANLAGLTVGSARNAWAALKKKINSQAIGDGSSPSTPAPKAKASAIKGTGKKRPPPINLPANDAGEEDETDIETPTKKTKNGKLIKGKGKLSAKDEGSEDHDVVEGYVKVKEESKDEDADYKDEV